MTPRYVEGRAEGRPGQPRGDVGEAISSLAQAEGVNHCAVIFVDSIIRIFSSTAGFALNGETN